MVGVVLLVAAPDPHRRIQLGPFPRTDKPLQHPPTVERVYVCREGTIVVLVGTELSQSLKVERLQEALSRRAVPFPSTQSAIVT